VDRQGLVARTIGDEQEEQFNPALSPSGDRVAVTSQESGNDDIWLHEITSAADGSGRSRDLARGTAPPK